MTQWLDFTRALMEYYNGNALTAASFIAFLYWFQPVRMLNKAVPCYSLAPLIVRDVKRKGHCGFAIFDGVQSNQHISALVLPPNPRESTGEHCDVTE